MMRRAAIGSFAMLVLACGPVASEPEGTSAPSSTTTLALQTTTSLESTTTTRLAREPFEWPESGEPAQWASTSMDLPGTTHVNATHGPLGFLSINNVSRGVVVRISQDGVTWTETAILTGPNGEEQVEPSDMMVTEEQYIVVGRTWTNTSQGSEDFRNGIWRSSDARTWTFQDLDEVEAGARVLAMAQIDTGRLLVGVVLGDSGSNPRPLVWLEDHQGEYENVAESIEGFDQSGYVEGVFADGQRAAIWGENDHQQYFWSTLDLVTWTRAEVGLGTSHRVTAAIWFDGLWVITSRGRVLISDDGESLASAAGTSIFATDEVSDGWATFAGLHIQDGYLVAQATVGYKSHTAWCYVDRTDCRRFPSTVLVSPNGYEWRHIPIPGQGQLPDHPVEIHSMLVDGKLNVVHTLGQNATLSVLEGVDGAMPLNTGEEPDLPFEVAEPFGSIKPGVEYGYALSTHCTFSPIGPLNDLIWIVENDSLVESARKDLGSVGGYGFIRLTADNEIEYIVNGLVIAKYLPDPTVNSAGFCD